MLVIIYGRNQCSYCIKAKNLAEKLKNERNNFDYKYIDIIKENISKKDIAKKIGKTINTMPQIIIDDKYIGGYTDFEYYVKNILT